MCGYSPIAIPKFPVDSSERAFSKDPLDEGTQLRFLINTNTLDGEHTFGYPFQAKRNFYDYPKDLMFRVELNEEHYRLRQPRVRQTG